MSFGFIITRHVDSKKSNEYWLESIHCIRKFHSNPIIVIDDNSDEQFLTNAVFENVTIIKSEFPKRGELLPYYYFYKLKPFDKAVILHDSVFLQKPFEVDSISDVKFIWHFPADYCSNAYLEINLLMKLDNNFDYIELYNNETKWNGCFGVMSCITYEFLKKIVEHSNLFVLIDHIQNRCDRMNLERVFGVVCKYHTNVESIHGDIRCSYFPFPIDYEFYTDTEFKHTVPIVKVWTGR